MSNGPNSGSGSESAPIGEFTDSSAETLLAKVDFLGIVGRIGRSGVLAVFTGLAGIAMAIEQSIDDLFETARQSIIEISGVVASFGTGAMSVAAETAEAEIPMFGLFAAPVSVVVVLSVPFTIGVVAYIFAGGLLE